MTGSGPLPRARQLLREAGERVRRQYGSSIGRHRGELATPALVLDIDAAQRNIDRMAGALRDLGRAAIRPHYKTHKSTELARRQLAAGAAGLSAATAWEAAVLAGAGMDDIFVVNTVSHPAKLAVLAELARERRILVAVDEMPNAAALSEAAARAGSVLGVLVEVDTGMDRCGVDTPEAALELARCVAGLPGLSFEGITGYEGHCSLTLDDELRRQRQREAMAFFTGVADLLESRGAGCPIRSAGGVATWQWTAAHPGITEIQAGTYVVMDNYHCRMAPGFEHSLTVQASVISRQSGKVIVDAGSKSVAGPADVTIAGHGHRPFRFDEEHGIFAAPDGSPLRVGDSVALVPGYSPTTVNWYDAYHVVRDDIVVDVWPVIPRGPGHHGVLCQAEAPASRR
jgi:D-serine deaminase-like pyridoxal phosphate-dependent protein